MPRDLQTPPKYAPDAIATPRGWEDAKTGELLVSVKGLEIAEKKKPAKKKAPVKKKAKKVEETPVEETVDISSDEE